MRSPLKPLYLMHQAGLSHSDKKAVLDGIKELLTIVEREALANEYTFEVFDNGIWQTAEYKNPDGSLREFHSVDWYVAQGYEPGKQQLNAQKIQETFFWEPWRTPRKGGQEHYDVLVLHEDICTDDTNFVIGLAHRGVGTTISTYRFKGLESRMRFECIKTETMHELGHVLDLPAENRTNLNYSLGSHCKNVCVMRQGLDVPDDWINITRDRLRYGPLCADCTADLRRHFHK